MTDRDLLPKELRTEYENMLARFNDPLKQESFNLFVNFVESRTNYLTAPASTKFHLSCKHGLLIHSLSVTSLMFDDKQANPLVYSDIPDDSIIVTGMFHDLGKAGLSLEDPYYLECEPTPRQKEFGFSPSQPYKVNVSNDYTHVSSGIFEHAHSSALMVAKFYSAANWDELFSILIHDGTEKDTNKDYTFKECKLQTLLHRADLLSSKWVETKE